MRAAAGAVPLSSAEIGLLLIDAGSKGPEDPEMFDVIEHAVVTVYLHRAYTFCCELKDRLTDAEIEIFVGAARQWAIAEHVDPADMKDPLS